MHVPPFLSCICLANDILMLKFYCITSIIMTINEKNGNTIRQCVRSFSFLSCFIVIVTRVSVRPFYFLSSFGYWYSLSLNSTFKCVRVKFWWKFYIKIWSTFYNDDLMSFLSVLLELQGLYCKIRLTAQAKIQKLETEGSKRGDQDKWFAQSLHNIIVSNLKGFHSFPPWLRHLSWKDHW